MFRAIWFSRHQPSREQIEDADRLGYTLEVTPKGIALGAMDLQNEGDVQTVVSKLLAHCTETGTVAIFGVFAAPILAQIARTGLDILQRGCLEPAGGKGDYPCFAAWNIMRSVEGSKPTFAHKQWLYIGHLNQDTCRWL